MLYNTFRVLVLCFILLANQESHKAEVSRLKQIIADLESHGSELATTVR